MFEFTKQRDIVFAKGDVGYPQKIGEIDLTLDIYQPVATADLPEKLPAMIFVFGGGYKKGSKSIGYIRDLCEYYAKRGYVTAAIDYRLLQHQPSAVANPLPRPIWVPEELFVVVNAAVQDTANAVRWLRHNAADYNIDPTRIGVGGVSAGALNAMFAGHAEADVLGANADVAAVLCLMGPLGINHELIDANDPPTFFAHGEKDFPILIQPAIEKLKANQVSCQVCMAPNIRHRIVPILETVVDGKTIRDHSVTFCFEAMKLSELVDK
jgi:dienelactone hydrolase